MVKLLITLSLKIIFFRGFTVFLGKILEMTNCLCRVKFSSNRAMPGLPVLALHPETCRLTIFIEEQCMNGSPFVNHTDKSYEFSIWPYSVFLIVFPDDAELISFFWDIPRIFLHSQKRHTPSLCSIRIK